MKYDDLVKFVDDTLRKTMQHIYQPLLIRSLVEMGGTATLRQLAHAFLSQDESQLQYYEDKIKKMPLKVLKDRGVVSFENGLVVLNVKQMTYEQKAQIKMLCEKRLQEYVVKRGLGIWDYRLLDTDPVPGTLRERVLREANGRCALCGATKEDRPLDVDHIQPRSKGGKNAYENLQALCSKCNRGKGNRNDFDYRGVVSPEQADDCAFCDSHDKSRVVEELGTVFAIRDKYPVTEGHMLIIPKRHAQDYFDMTLQERRDTESLLEILRKRLSEDDPSISGFNVGMNCGEDAGQTIFHAHIHLIPRRKGDVDVPRGGVRGCVPTKMDYKP